MFEATHPKGEVHLHCGSRQKIGVPSSTSSHSISPSSISTPFDHGWSRLAFNNPPNPTTTTTKHDHMMRLHMSMTTPSSHRSNSSKYIRYILIFNQGKHAYLQIVTLTYVIQ